jgi:hypothetical protein
MTGIRRVSQLGTTGESTYVDGSIQSVDIAGSIALTGVPTAPTATLGTNTTQLATTAFVTASKTLATPTTNGVVKGLTGDYVAEELFLGFAKGVFNITVTNPSGTVLVVTLNNGDTWDSALGSTGFTTAEFVVGRIVNMTADELATDDLNFVTGGVISSFTSNTLTVSSYTSTSGPATTENNQLKVKFPAVSSVGFGNTFLGNNAGIGLTALAGYSSETASNIAIGENAMSQGVVKAGGYQTDNNIVIGPNAGNNFYGANNIIIGRTSGNALTNAQSSNSYSNFIGFNTGSGVASSSGLTIIGNNLPGSDLAGGNDAVVLGASGTYGVRIKNTGAVTMPNQPAFRYHGWTMTASGLQGGTAPLNRGNSLSIGSGGTYSRFTAPVAGLYFFGASCLIETGTVRVEFIFTKNGSGTIDGYDTYAMNDSAPAGGGYTNVSGSFILQLAAGDYIGMTPPVFGTLHANATRGDRMFQGYLIG